ncbi:hypothetical protein ACKWTF_007254 [Chironomus riparius]
MNNENRPIPVPRPRQLKTTSDEIDSSSKVYENFTIRPKSSASFYDAVNAQLNEMKLEMQKPLPSPRTKLNTRNYENSPLNNNQPELPSKTGAIRKAINIPKVENNIKETTEKSNLEERKKETDDVLSLSSSTSGKSNSEKFVTPSPTDILKSIGSSSKILGEAITERIGDKTASAKHKIIKEYKNSKNILGSLASDTKTSTAKKLTKVKEKFDNFSLKRNKARRSLSIDADERPQTINIANDDMFETLSFNSPINNQRSYNLENIPSQISTYEIPKGFKYKSHEDLPTYEDIIYDDGNLKRNTKMTQSLHGVQNNFNKKRSNISDSNLNTISSDSSELDDHESLPPNIPVPKLPGESVYGKLKPAPTYYENAPMIPLRKPPPPPVLRRNINEQQNNNNISDDSNRVTMCSTVSESCTLTDVADSRENTINRNARGIDRSESWRYVSNDNISQVTLDSNESEEPIYANDENERMGNLESPTCSSNVLQPLKILNIDGSNSKTPTITREILNEFDPLSRDSFDTYIMRSMNHITLLETLLSEDTYGTVADSQSLLDAEQVDEASSEDSNQTNENLSSLSQSEINISNKSINEHPSPPRPKRKKEAQRQQSVIIHQNLRLKDSIENLAEPYLAKVDNEASTSEVIADLSKPKTTRTNWFVDTEDSEKFSKNNLDNPNNFTNATSTNKVSKTVPQLPKVNNLSLNTETPYLPSYEESQKDQIVIQNDELDKTPTIPVTKSKSTIFNFNLMSKLNSKDKTEKVDPKDFIPHPPFSDDTHSSHDKGIILFKLPSGVIEDMLKELNPRFIELKKRQFKAFAEPEFKVLKEHLDLTHLTSVHYLINHKFNDFKTECGRQIYCFEINLAIPKNTGSNNNALLDSKGSPVRTQRVTYVYGIHSKQEKCIWMQKILRGVTNVFPKEYTSDYIRSGWCYMRKSITSAWSGTWILLSRRRLLFYDYTENRLEILDLRKARCIGLKDSDDSIQNLYVEKGPIMLIDAPPFTCYFIMNTTRETKIWSVVIKDEAHTNGTQLRHQQLTKDNVPVFVDKCINFVYTNGTMSEGIYRKAGSSSNIQKLSAALRKDAFNVQITRCEYNEHDVSSALKRFFRELPEPLMGKFAVSFLSVSEMKSQSDKLHAYKELLLRLPSVEYQTLKKLLGHLHFIQTQKDVNKMKSENLALVFGPTLMQPQNNENQYTIDTRDSEVVAELITNYKKLYELTADEIKTEQIMLTVLQKYHNAAENLSDAVKKSGDFKVWITLDPNPDQNTIQEDKKQINVALTPTKTVFELCKELESNMNIPAYKMTLMEVILNGELQRPLHYNEKVLNVVLRWANWPEADRKTNYLELRPQNKFHQQLERALKTLPSLTPCTELKFADKKTKSMKLFTLELTDTMINVLKTEKSSKVKVKDVDVSNCITYLGAEKKRDNQCRWTLTLVELNFNKRSRDSPFIGHIIGGNNINDQVIWYTSIMNSIHGQDIFPNPEIVMA